MVARTRRGKSLQEEDVVAQPEPELPAINELSDEELRALVELRAQRYLGMSVDDFVRRWHAGEISNPDRREVLLVAIPLGLA